VIGTKIHCFAHAEIHAALECGILDQIYLAAPPAADGSPRRWIPCSKCETVEALPCNVVSAVCWRCAPPKDEASEAIDRDRLPK